MRAGGEVSFNRMRLSSLAAAAVMAALPAGLRAQVGLDSAPSVRTYRVVDGDSLRAYVFLPEGGAARRSVVLLFHGGGWSSGSPEWTYPAARRFAGYGMVAIPIEYRLARGRVTPWDALDDVCAAYAWVATVAPELGIDTARVAGYGVSAGGHLVASTATVGCPKGTAGAALPRALLLWSPALDLSRDGWFAKLLHGRTTAEAMSPAYHVSGRTPPTSIVIGEEDILTPLAGARRFCEGVIAVGHRCDIHAYPGVGHLLTRNLRNQENDFDPDPAFVADGIARHREFLAGLGYIDGGD